MYASSNVVYLILYLVSTEVSSSELLIFIKSGGSQKESVAFETFA